MSDPRRLTVMFRACNYNDDDEVSLLNSMLKKKDERGPIAQFL